MVLSEGCLSIGCMCGVWSFCKVEGCTYELWSNPTDVEGYVSGVWAVVMYLSEEVMHSVWSGYMTKMGF